MKATKKWHKTADTIHIVYGASIIILAILVGLLVRTVVGGEDFPLSGSSDAEAHLEVE